jgi:patatin-related protein
MPPIHNLELEDYEDLRLTVVMNGGVSLAVWIGGVAQEIHRLEGAEGAYAQLVDFTATHARVDVISGTSAGGINGAFLAVAQVYKSSLAALRNVWLQSASLDELLRDPREKNPPSLLRGQYFSDELLKAFKLLIQPPPRTTEDASIDLSLTTTLLHGIPSQLTDDFGAPINDPNHRGIFHFRRRPDLAIDDFVDPSIAAQLTIACRSTASFPVAFDPVFCRIIASEGSTAARMSSVSNFQTDRYLLDGGILDNKPLDRALSAMVLMPSKGELRRVVCYVVPSSGETASNEPDTAQEPPTTMEVAIASMSELPLAQSISGQIEQIKEHNRSVRELRQTRRALAALGWPSVRTTAQRLFASYQRRRAESASIYVTDEIVKRIVPVDPNMGVGRRRRDWIAKLFVEVFTKSGLPWVPTFLPSEDPKLSDLDLDNWQWGLFTVENIAGLTMDILRRAINLIAIAAPDKSTKALSAAAELRRIRNEAEHLLITILALRQSGGDSFKESAKDFPDSSYDSAKINHWVQNALQADARRGEYGRIALTLARFLATSAPHVRVIASRAMDRARWTAERQVSNELLEMLNLVAPEGKNKEAVLARLLHIEVVQFALGFSGKARQVADQFLELVEVCPDNSGLIGLEAARGHKPAGTGLANFGGFYKKSWRANDWMLGRLNGAERLTQIMLDPERIRRLYFGQDISVVCRQIASVAIPPLGDPDEPGCRARWRKNIRLVQEELSFLQDSEQILPEQLIHTADAILYRFQLGILREELPLVASAIREDIQEHHGPGKSTTFLDQIGALRLNQPYPPLQKATSTDVENLYRSYAVDQETIAEQSTTDRFPATITRAFAIAISMLAGENAGIPGVRKIARVLRLPVLITDAISQSLIRASKVGIFTYAVVIGGSLAIRYRRGGTGACCFRWFIYKLR